MSSPLVLVLLLIWQLGLVPVLPSNSTCVVHISDLNVALDSRRAYI